MGLPVLPQRLLCCAERGYQMPVLLDADTNDIKGAGRPGGAEMNKIVEVFSELRKWQTQMQKL